MRGSAFSSITRALQAGCFLKLHGKFGLLATSGFRRMPLSSKVRAFAPGFLSLPDTLLDVCGKLVGESIIGAAVRDTPLWWFEEPPLSPASESQPVAGLPNWNSSPTPLSGDWREPIRQMLQSQDVNIRITIKPPENSVTSPSPSIVSSGHSVAGESAH